MTVHVLKSRTVEEAAKMWCPYKVTVNGNCAAVVCCRGGHSD